MYKYHFLMVRIIPFLPFQYAVLIFWFTGQFLVGIFRYSGYTTAQFKLEASGADFFLNMLIYITTGLAYSFIHVILINGIEQLNKSVLDKYSLAIPVVIVDIIMTLWYTADITIQSIELILQMETAGNVSVDYFFAYMLSYNKPTVQTYYESGDKTKDIGDKIFQYSIMDHGWSYIYLLFAVGTPILMLFTFFILYIPEHIKIILPNISQSKQQSTKCFKLFNNMKEKQKDVDNLLVEQEHIDTVQEQSLSTHSNKSNNDLLQADEQAFLQPQNKTLANFEWRRLKFRRVGFKHNVFNIFAIFQLCGAICFIIYVTIYAVRRDAFKMESYMPATIKFINQGQMKSLNNKLYKKYVSDFRSEKYGYMQRNNLYFIDNRENVIYPTIKGTTDQFCSYNYYQNKTFCDNWLQQQNNIQVAKTSESDQYPEQPNILFLIIESFSPSPRYVDDNFAQKSDGTPKLRYNTTFYSNDVMPNINKLASTGIVIPQTTSHGLPTIFGFLGLATTEKPVIGGINIVSDKGNDDEAFSRQLKTTYNYYTSYVDTTPTEFDYQNAWVLNKQWYDEVHYYYPTSKQLKILGLEQGSHSSWLSDRISSRIAALNIARLFAANGKYTAEEAANKYYAFFNQTPDLQLLTEYLINETENLQNSGKIKQNQPIFLQYFNADTHNPFSGFDNASFYKQFETDPKDTYQTVLRAYDHHMGELVELFRLFDNNTLVFLTGDHGQHDESVFRKGGEQVNKNLFMNKKYQFGHVGSDVMFDVSSLISDLNGGDIISQFGIDKKSVLEAAFDHDDLIESMFDILSRFKPRDVFSFKQQKQKKGNEQLKVKNNVAKSFRPISGRHAKSVLDTVEQLKNNSYEDDKLYTSFTDVFWEGKYQGKTLRTNTKKLSNSVLMTNYVPSFTVFQNGTEVQKYYDDKQMKKELYDKIVARQLLYTHLGSKNMLYNKNFENKTCRYNPDIQNFTLCDLPQPLNNNMTYRSDFLIVYYGLIIICGGVLISLVVILIFYSINLCYVAKQQKKFKYT